MPRVAGAPGARGQAGDGAAQAANEGVNTYPKGGRAPVPCLRPGATPQRQSWPGHTAPRAQARGTAGAPGRTAAGPGVSEAGPERGQRSRPSPPLPRGWERQRPPCARGPAAAAAAAPACGSRHWLGPAPSSRRAQAQADRSGPGPALPAAPIPGPAGKRKRKSGGAAPPRGGGGRGEQLP